jgi:micrococcal nuclease
MYFYKAICRRVIDGDTIEVDIDLGCNTWIHVESVRLYGIDTPETRSKDLLHKQAGLLVKEYLKSELEGKELFIRTHKDKEGKFGRYLVEVFETETSVMSINQSLLDSGIARIYTNNTTTPWEQSKLLSIVEKLHGFIIVAENM